MTYGRIIGNIKYIHLYNDRNLKNLSLEDNVYFTLRDIFLNAESIDDTFIANSFNEKLTNGICFEDRNESFTYTNVLDDIQYLSSLVNWLWHFNKHYFDFEPITLEEKINMDEYIDMDDYIRFDNWWDKFVNLRKLLQKKIDICIT